MQENYFTGQIDVNHQNNQQNKSISNQQTKQQLNQQHQISKSNQVNQIPDHKQPQQQQKYVDVSQVTVQKQDIEQQRFIQNNPQIAKQQKLLGNNKYNEKIYNQALVCYRKAIQYTDQQNEQNKKFKSVLFSNIGLTYMKMNQEESSIQYFQKAIKLNQNYTKARTNLAQCYEQTDKLQQALEQYQKVYQATPNDLFIKQKIDVLSVKVHQLQEKRKQQVIGGLKNLGNSILGFFGMSLDNFKLEKGPGGGYNISMKQ